MYGLDLTWQSRLSLLSFSCLPPRRGFSSGEAKAGSPCVPLQRHIATLQLVKSAPAAAAHTTRGGLITFVLSGVSGQQNCTYRTGHRVPQETAVADLAHFWRSSTFRAFRQHFRFCTSPCLATPAFLPLAQVRVIGACLRFKAGCARYMLLSAPSQSSSRESWPTVPDK